MAVEISWRQPRRVIYARYSEVVTIEELISTPVEFLRLMDEGDAPIHNIIDLSAVREFPKSLSQVRRALETELNSKSGRVLVVIGPNPFLQFITHVISEVLFRQAQFTFCNSLAEAVDYLRQFDPTVTLEVKGFRQ